MQIRYQISKIKNQNKKSKSQKVVFFILNTILIFIFCTLYNHSYAQSFFSMKGFGEEVLYHDAQAASLGGLVNLGYANPSAPLILEKTEFRATITGNFVLGQQGNQRRMIYDIRPLLISGKIALPYKFGLGMKLVELFDQNFDVYSDSIQVGNYWTRRHIIGRGGIYGIFAQLSKRLLNDKLALGLEYAKLIGQELEQWNFEVFQGSYTTSDTVEIQYAAHMLRAGFLTNFKCWTIGFIAEDIRPGTISQKVMSHNSIIDSMSGTKINLPTGIGLGIAFKKIPKTTIFADFFMRNWSQSTINDTIISRYSNSMKISTGVEYLLTDNTPLRFGLKLYQSYQTDINHYKISEYALTIGSRIAIPKFGGFDVGLELAQRQGRDVKETIGRLGFSLAYEEAWKKRIRRWGY